MSAWSGQKQELRSPTIKRCFSFPYTENRLDGIALLSLRKNSFGHRVADSGPWSSSWKGELLLSIHLRIVKEKIEKYIFFFFNEHTNFRQFRARIFLMLLSDLALLKCSFVLSGEKKPCFVWRSFRNKEGKNERFFFWNLINYTYTPPPSSYSLTCRSSSNPKCKID